MGRIGNIINRKGKQDAKRASVFTKHARAISVAAKEGGADPEYKCHRNLSCGCWWWFW